MDRLHSRKALFIYFLLTIVILYAGWSLMVWDDTRIKDFVLASVPAAESEDDHIFRIESIRRGDDGISITKDRIVIDGFIVRKGWPASRAAIHIILKNTETGQCYELPTTVVMRTDVTELLDDGNNYNMSGFHTDIPEGGVIDTEKYDYEICALFDVNNIPRIVASGTTVRTWEGGS